MSSMNGTVQCVEIAIVNDSLSEEVDERFNISLILVNPNDIDGGSPLAVHIVDNGEDSNV